MENVESKQPEMGKGVSKIHLCGAQNIGGIEPILSKRYTMYQPLRLETFEYLELEHS